MKTIFKIYRGRAVPALRSGTQRRNAAATANSPRSGGFTLLELLVVITMMVFITTIAAMNYFGAMRSAGYSAVSNDVFNALLMARQRACVDNKPVYFYLLNATNYVIMESFGTIAKVDTNAPAGTFPGGLTFFDPYVEASAFRSNMTLINIDLPGSGAIVCANPETGTLDTSNVNASGGWILYQMPACELHVTNNLSCASFAWNKGDRYGTPIFAIQMLPKGFAFSKIPPTLLQGQAMVLFQPDGTVDITGDNLQLFYVVEMLKPDTTHTVKFSIFPNGQISQQ